jgi:cyclase
MLKNRIIACLPIFQDKVVQSIQFKKKLPLGKPKIIIEFLCSWGVDEIVILDIEAGRKNGFPNWALIESIASASDVPITYGGAISTPKQARDLIANGVDKISLNSVLHSNMGILKEISEMLGSQSLIVSLDFQRNGPDYELFDSLNNSFQKVVPEKLALLYGDAGIGELLITSIDRYGMKNGYDIELMKKFTDNTDVPVIALGGGYKTDHIVDLALASKVRSFAIENAFFFKEQSVTIYKALLSGRLKVRDEDLIYFKNQKFDFNERLEKKDEIYLYELFYEEIARREI